MALRHLIAGAAMLAASTGLASAATITIATVNNGDMIKMQKLAPQWEKATGNKINWVVLEENVLRQRVTTDIATKGGQFDILTIGSYETPIWGKQGWLVPLDFPASYDIKDVFPGVRDALSADGKLYAAPFYAESSFTLYRKDLFEKAGLTMPAKPTYDEIAKFADKLTDKSREQYGVCLRGKAGWGENMALVDTLVNGFGGQWFDMKWNAELDTKPWHDALNWYVDLMHRDGPPGATSNGFNENLALFTTGHCGIWIDATSAAGLVYDKATSQVWDKTGFTAAPHGVTSNGTGWFWAWAMAIPTTSKQQAAAKDFLAWSTSKAYIDLVGKTFGYTVLPPGTRISTYANPEYLKAAPFAEAVKTAILTADITKPSMNPVPYVGIQYVAIPEFQAMGTQVGQMVAAALAGQTTVDQALKQAQQSVTNTMEQAGYK
jgi:ABC-type glycerol-3-phosphate transport system substrate-binding protein